MAQWAKVLDAKPDNLSLIPRTHMVERGNRNMDTVAYLHMRLVSKRCLKKKKSEAVWRAFPKDQFVPEA